MVGNNGYLDVHDARNILNDMNKITGKRKVAIDIRVSTEHEKQIDALGNQKQWALELARQYKDKWQFDETKDLYVEEGISGTSLKKCPAFADMIHKAKNGVYNLIVVREVSRFMRNAKIVLELVDELKEYGVEVYFVNDGIWTYNTDDYFKLTIMAQYAEQESRKISERVFSGQATARSNGIHFGNGNILGYDLVKGEKSCDTTYKINEEEAATVRKIFELSLKGYGMKRIRQYLEDNGYKTAQGKTKWYESTIERILRKRTYLGEYEYLQSVTSDPLKHSRINNIEKSKHIIKKGDFPAIIDPDTWYAVQDAINSRIGFSKGDKQGKKIMMGYAGNKDIYCRKLRCGCGRRFRKDIQTTNNTATYRCYQLVDDRNQEERARRSKILQDNCSVFGIRDWKIDLFTLRVFDYLECNIREVRERLLSVVDDAFVATVNQGYSQTDIKKIVSDIEKLNRRNENLIDMREGGEITRETYLQRKKKNDDAIQRMMEQKSHLESEVVTENEKKQVMAKVKAYVDEALRFPDIMGDKISVPEEMIDTYVNSIKACADNVYEYNRKINPNAKVQIPVVPDSEFNPKIHSAKVMIDNSKAVLIGEFVIDYEEAKNYANRRRRKVKRVHWDKPAVIRIYADL
ncbi:MAG: recombinase family protein [Eubacterium sp.]|nr:recombinase family protein [Eubacterium sp.]